LIDHIEIKAMALLRAGGATFKAIGERYGITGEAVSARLRSRGLHRLPTRTCALHECGSKFDPRSADQICCSSLHTKRQEGRRLEDVFIADAVCKLPECREPVVQRGIKFGRFCCRNHMERHANRTKSGFYDRLLGKGPECIECGERLVLDEHHVEYTVNGSNKQSETIILCPTHHMAIHRSLAEYTEDGFVWKVDAILEGLESGDSWGTAKG